MPPTDDPVFANPPRKHVLLLSCMDTRLLDDTVRFMNDFNLQNRYDHLIFAGAAMGVRLLESPSSDPKLSLPWKNVFFDHLVAAIDKLHRDIKDIFIIEHLDCGAYKCLHPDTTTRAEYAGCDNMTQLKKYHQIEARELTKEIEAFCRDRHTKAQEEAAVVRKSDLSELEKFKQLQKLEQQIEAWKEIHVRRFLMDLRGGVKKL